VKRTLLRSLAITAGVIAGWTLLGGFFVSQDIAVVQIRIPGRISVEEVAIWGALTTLVWMCVTPFILWAAQFIPPWGRSWKRAAGAFLGIALVFAIIRALLGALFVPVLESRALEMKDFPRAVGVQTHGNLVLASIVIGARVFYDASRRIRERERHALTLEAQLARAQLEQLRGQLQPHFLFNAINGIAALVHKDPDRADEMLMELSALLRSTLDLGRSDTIPLRRELEIADHYLHIQSMRFEDRLRIRRDIADDTLSCEVPALILQPLLENSLRHVVANRTEPSTVEVSTRRDGDRLVLSVIDDGPGFDPSSTRLGVGISNTKARLEQLYRGDAQLDFRHDGRQFAIDVNLPLREVA
jgi:two-component system LytT family sensor kinase